MQDLQLVGVHDDGRHVVLAAEDGTRFRVPIDDRLRLIVRSERAVNARRESPLRPRDIQALVRAGMNAAQIAEQSGMSIEQVERFEGPVVAERQHVAELARKQVVRVAGRTEPLLDVVVDRLATRNAVPGEWDAWRREDGVWTVQLQFHAGDKDRVATWSFDPGRRSLDVQDDEARWLCSREQNTADEPIRPRLAAVQVAGIRSPQPQTAPQDATSALVDELNQRRGVRQPLLTVDDLVDDDPPPAHPPLSRPERATDAEIVALPELAIEQPMRRRAPRKPPAETPAAPAPDQVTTEPQDEQIPGQEAIRVDAPRRSTRRGRRSSVPSWDEIMFGTKRD